MELDGESLTLDSALAIAFGENVSFGPGVKERVDECARFVREVAKRDQSVYGVNTGFGYFAKTKISNGDLKRLQYNILRSHASGFGKPISIPDVRLAMALRLNVFCKGLTGVSFALCELLKECINREIYPIIPEYGSVGASGDLAPLAHLALPLIGEGEVFYKNRIMPALEALQEAGLQPIELGEKEGLGLINGTQVMLSIGSIALGEARKLIHLSSAITALTYEAMQANLTPLHPNIHSSRGQTGQMIIAHEIMGALEGSYLHERAPLKLQDPYSLRCAPQVHGAALDALSYAILVVERELNAATDNPLVFPAEDLIVSGGNFHGEPLAMAFDFAAIALSELANISERRIELMLNPNMSGLPAFLTKNEGLCSGYMASQYLAASLVNECKLLANPASTDSIPGNVGVEDHVSMGMTSARKLAKITELVFTVYAVELLAACQAIDLRGVPPSGELYKALRDRVPVLEGDRILANDVEAAVEICRRIV